MTDIVDVIKKTMLMGIGLALTAKDEMEEMARDIEKRLDMNEEEGKRFIKDVRKRYDESQRKLEDRVEKTVREFLKKADIVTSDELKALKKEIRELKQSLNKEAQAGEE